MVLVCDVSALNFTCKGMDTVLVCALMQVALNNNIISNK